jgi:phosphoribosylformylglycinamidine synthase
MSRDDLETALMEMLASPSVVSSHRIADAYSRQDLSDTVVSTGEADACVMRAGDPGEAYALGVAMACCGSQRFCATDPKLGAESAVVACVRRLACVGATPVAATSQLIPSGHDLAASRPALRELLAGVTGACREMASPVVDGDILPCGDGSKDECGAEGDPGVWVSMVGSLDDCDKVVGKGFVTEGDIIVMVGETADELGGSQYLHVRHSVDAGAVPQVDFERERVVNDVLCQGIDAGLIHGAHACGEGGLAVALVESAVVGGHGFVVALDDDLDPASSLFSETQGRVIVTVDSEHSDDLADLLDATEVPYTALGAVHGDRVRIDDERQHTLIDLPLEQVSGAYDSVVD